MANIKIIDLPTGSPELDSFLEATQVNEQAASGRSSAKIAFGSLANWIAGQGADPVEYGDLNTEDETLIGGINELHGVDGYDVYDETRTSSNKYVQGDICIHNNSLQVCTAANGAYGAWDSSKWSPTTIKALLASKQDELTVQTGSGTFSVQVSSDSSILTKKWGAVFFGEVTIKTTSDITTYHTELGDMGALCPSTLARYSARGSAGNTVRLEINNGKLLSESKLTANEYYTISAVII